MPLVFNLTTDQFITTPIYYYESPCNFSHNHGHGIDRVQQ